MSKKIEASPPPEQGPKEMEKAAEEMKKVTEEKKKAAEKPANDKKIWSNPLDMILAAAKVVDKSEDSANAGAGADQSVAMEDAAGKSKEAEASKPVSSKFADFANRVVGFVAPAKRGEKRRADSSAEEKEPAKKQKPEPIHPMIRAERKAGTGPVINETRTFKFAGNGYSRLPNPQFTQSRLRQDYFPTAPLREKFIREDVTSGNMWVFSKQIGQGGFGTAELWYLMNQDDRVLDEVVIKHCSIPQKDHDDWRFWEDGWETTDDNGNNFVRKRVLEAAIHDRLTKTRPWNETGISEFITSWLAPNKKSYKLYLQYAYLGTLDRIFPMSDDKKREEENWQVPEPIIWYWLHCMMRAALTMQQGFAELPQGQLPPLTALNWKPIVHFDIKDQNVVLQLPDKDENDLIGEKLNWPMPLLIDFGLAIELLDPKKYNWDNPKDYKCGGTPGYRAPEQLGLRHLEGPDKDKRFPYSSQTNVFGIGMTVYNLIRGDHSQDINRLTEWGRDEMHARGDDHELVWPEDTPYSEGLRGFIGDCVARDPKGRPAVDEDLLDHLGGECRKSFLAANPEVNGRSWGPFAGFIDRAARLKKAFDVFVEDWIPFRNDGRNDANNYGEEGYGEEDDEGATQEQPIGSEQDAEGETDEDMEVEVVKNTKEQNAEEKKDTEGEAGEEMEVEVVPETKVNDVPMEGT